MSRIIAGSRGGQRLAMPSGDATRPTTDRVREALFSAIAAWAGRSAEPVAETLSGLSFLDLYAGSGAVGLEAASRGAGPVVLVEASKRTAAASTNRNVATLGLAAQVRAVRVEALARQSADRAYDLTFADPPYELEAAAVDGVLADLLVGGWLAPDGLVVVERSSRTPELTWPVGFETWTRRYGETVLHFGAR